VVLALVSWDSVLGGGGGEWVSESGFELDGCWGWLARVTLLRWEELVEKVIQRPALIGGNVVVMISDDLVLLMRSLLVTARTDCSYRLSQVVVGARV
jgi:hypothetical protein